MFNLQQLLQQFQSMPWNRQPMPQQPMQYGGQPQPIRPMPQQGQIGMPQFPQQPIQQPTQQPWQGMMPTQFPRFGGGGQPQPFQPMPQPIHQQPIQFGGQQLGGQQFRPINQFGPMLRRF